jgi:hypothetical protein
VGCTQLPVFGQANACRGGLRVCSEKDTRRIAKGLFDDAVARLYRAVEALAQAQLSSHDFFNTAAVSFEKLPDTLKREWRDRPKDKDGCLKLALQDDYKLLSALGDKLGKKFTEQKLDTPKSPLSLRNQSILAHGYQPISQKAAEGLLTATLELAGCKVENLLTFPEI